MLEKILKMYVMAMTYGTRSPLPHLFGPPGCGKSTVVQQAADLLGVNLHIINLSRVSPLELEGVQMPHTDGENQKLRLLHATFWTQIKPGDIVLFDEALRAFPEVFNGLLDILTSRKVADLVLPDAFFIAASNSTVSYDKALEDRLLHLPVPDLRKNKSERKRIAEHIVEVLGLMPQMATSAEMVDMIATDVLPTYAVLDELKGQRVGSSISIGGYSVRNLIGQAQLREVKSSNLKDLIHMNNVKAGNAGKLQYVLLIDGKSAPSGYVDSATYFLSEAADKLTEVQRKNIQLNLQLIEMEAQRKVKEDEEDDDIDEELFS